MKEIPHALCHEALFSKSKVYIKRGLKAHVANDIEEFILWASLSLELLGKSALAKKLHPALIADPLSYESLFASCGHQVSTNIKTIAAKTLFERLKHIDKKFDVRCFKFCENNAIRRNAELHSGESPFTGTAIENWEQEFWTVADIILQIRNQTLEKWLGLEDSKMPKDIIQKASIILEKNMAQRVLDCKNIFHKEKKSKTVESKNIENTPFYRSFKKEFDSYTQYPCCACHQSAEMGGNLWYEDSCEGEENSFDVEFVRRVYLVEAFLCLHCGLHAFGNREVKALRLPEDFSDIQEVEREFEPDYGND